MLGGLLRSSNIIVRAPHTFWTAAIAPTAPQPPSRCQCTFRWGPGSSQCVLQQLLWHLRKLQACHGRTLVGILLGYIRGQASSELAKVALCPPIHAPVASQPRLPPINRCLQVSALMHPIAPQMQWDQLARPELMENAERAFGIRASSWQGPAPGHASCSLGRQPVLSAAHLCHSTTWGMGP